MRQRVRLLQELKPECLLPLHDGETQRAGPQVRVELAERRQGVERRGAGGAVTAGCGWDTAAHWNFNSTHPGRSGSLGGLCKTCCG